MLICYNMYTIFFYIELEKNVCKKCMTIGKVHRTGFVGISKNYITKLNVHTLITKLTLIRKYVFYSL